MMRIQIPLVYHYDFHYYILFLSIVNKCSFCFYAFYPLVKRRKSNVLCTFNLHPVFSGSILKQLL